MGKQKEVSKRIFGTADKHAGAGGTMKKIFVVGGMGAGKSTVTHALSCQGIPVIDLDKVGHLILAWPVVKEDLKEAFGAHIFTPEGEVDRAALATAAFASEQTTHLLDNITLPRIEEALADCVESLSSENHRFVVIESSTYKGKESSFVSEDDCLVAVVAPEELRVSRAVAAGWQEDDVRSRIARQIDDAVRTAAAEVVFVNDGTPEELYDQVVSWWNEYQNQGER